MVLDISFTYSNALPSLTQVPHLYWPTFLEGLLFAGARKADKDRENITGYCSRGGLHSSKWPTLDSGHAQYMCWSPVKSLWSRTFVFLDHHAIKTQIQL